MMKISIFSALNVFTTRKNVCSESKVRLLRPSLTASLTYSFGEDKIVNEGQEEVKSAHSQLKPK